MRNIKSIGISGSKSVETEDNIESTIEMSPLPLHYKKNKERETQIKRQKNVQYGDSNRMSREKK